MICFTTLVRIPIIHPCWAPICKSLLSIHPPNLSGSTPKLNFLVIPSLNSWPSRLTLLQNPRDLTCGLKECASRVLITLLSVWTLLGWFIYSLWVYGMDQISRARFCYHMGDNIFFFWCNLLFMYLFCWLGYINV